MGPERESHTMMINYTSRGKCERVLFAFHCFIALRALLLLPLDFKLD